MIVVFFYAVFVFSLTFLLYVFVLYPVIVWQIGAGSRSARLATSENSAITTSVTILVPAYNEEDVIGEKLCNLLELDYPIAAFEILVISDGSLDQTDAIVERFIEKFPSRVNLFRIEERKGKTHAINSAIETIQSEIILFSDANAPHI